MIVLASASPRRQALLEQAGLGFEVEVSGVDEHLEGSPSPQAAAQELALRKAKSVATGRAAGDYVIGADTVVAIGSDAGGWRLLGKPGDEQEAQRMLTGLSNTRHMVVTGVAVIDCTEGQAQVDCESTWVTMRAIEPAEVEAYVESGEWRGKAGGYAIQENADAFVVALEGGGFDNVVGLPVELTLDLLLRSGVPAAELPRS